MQSNRPFSPTNPQRTGGILPPLSKYYYGPAVSPDRSPASSHAADGGWNAQSLPQGAPTLPPRPPQNPASAPPISQWSSHQNASLQQGRLPGPPPTAPPAHPVAQSSYNPNTYGPMPGARLSPINPTWNQSSHTIANVDTSKWGVASNHPSPQHSQPELKPPLPPRALSSQSEYHGTPPEAQVQSSQENRPFEYLRPVAYSPTPSPSIPQGSPLPMDNQRQEVPSQAEPQRLPPPPPRKVPLYNENGPDHQSDALSEQSHDSVGPLQNHSQREGTEGHVVDNSIDRQTLSSEAPSFTTIGHNSDKSYPSSWGKVDVKQHDGYHVPENPSGRGDSEAHFHGERVTNGTATSSSHQAQHTHTPSVALKENDTVAPNIEGEAYMTVDGNHRPHHDDSFYWHSPHSSASMSYDRDHNQDIPGTSSLLDATPEPQEQYISRPPHTEEPTYPSEKTTDLYQSTLGPYSASALGFGGPSDWEHFGDYEAEEVDDTDLYIRPRSPVKQTVPLETPELPGSPAPANVSPEQYSTAAEQPDRASSDILQYGLEPFSSTQPQPKQDQDQLDRHRGSQGHVHDTTQLTAADQQNTHKSTTTAQKSLLAQQATTEGNTTTYLPQFPFEQVQKQLKRPEDFADGSKMDIPTASANVPINHGNSSLKVGPRDESPILPPKVQLEEPLTAIEESMTNQEMAPLDTHGREDIEQSFVKSIDNQPRDEGRPQAEVSETTSELNDISRKNSIKRGSLLSDESVLSKIKEMDDLYADLDPWGKASLNRYVAMLREEARASTEVDKLNMYKAFVKKEWKLRAVLYGADDEQEHDPLSSTKDTLPQRANTLALRRPASKALPALPPDASQPQAEAIQPKSSVSSMNMPSLVRLMTTKEEVVAPQSLGEDAKVMVDTPGGERHQLSPEEDRSEAYSPGGRPIQVQARRLQRATTPSGANADNVATNKTQTTPLKEPASDGKPAYTPFRYSQGYIDDADQPLVRRASFRPYAALKIEPVEDKAENTLEAVRSSGDRDSLPPSGDDRDVRRPASSTQPEAVAMRKASDVEAQESSPVEPNPPLDLRRFERADFDPLIAVLPQSSQIPKSAVELSDLQHGMNAVPDDFSFIHQYVVAWDAKTKKIRIEHDRERQIRQGESEQRNDALFNDDEIGYGDISELESEFKRVEVARKTEEDRAEYQTFVREVFNAVWAQLHFEIDQLTPLYDEYSGFAPKTLAGKDMFEATHGQCALAPTMSALLTLHQKLEIRHQKAFEAVLERDRRLKKTEVASWYALGNVGKVKELEKQCELAERKAIAEYCKERNARSNRLMDVLDQNTLRGVGANQDYMEAVMKAVRRIASGRAFASSPASEPGLGMDQVIRAKDVTAVLASSSEQIVQTFHVADMLLNAADYELSVATARLANADSTTFERLKEERAKEDAKLMRDLQHRLALIREDSRRTNDEIVKLLCFLGVRGGHAQSGNMPKSPPIADLEHEQRLQKALEDARRRNEERAARDGLH
ncbi:MAG: hypothetical protein Q9170_002875 [Blastenia crenularia]